MMAYQRIRHMYNMRGVTWKQHNPNTNNIRRIYRCVEKTLLRIGDISAMALGRFWMGERKGHDRLHFMRKSSTSSNKLSIIHHLIGIAEEISCIDNDQERRGISHMRAWCHPMYTPNTQRFVRWHISWALSRSIVGSTTVTSCCRRFKRRTKACNHL